MTQTQEPPILQTPARRRALPAAPVLIRIPAVAGETRTPTRRTRRRRLRREVRVAGYLLLATLPLSLAYAVLGGDRHPAAAALTASIPTIEVSLFAPSPAAIPTLPGISISLEPALAAQAPDFAAAPSVFLSGQLLPADSSPEETTHGGH